MEVGYGVRRKRTGYSDRGKYMPARMHGVSRGLVVVSIVPLEVLIEDIVAIALVSNEEG